MRLHVCGCAALVVVLRTWLPTVVAQEALSDSTAPTPAAQPAQPFRFSENAIRLAKQTAATELAQRGDLKCRRPPGLEDIDSPAGLEQAIDLALRDLPNQAATDNAYMRLRYLGSAAFLPLVEALLTSDEVTRRKCATLLERHGARAIRPLEKTLTADESPHVRAAAAKALGNTFDPAAVPLLVAALNDPDRSVRTSAVFALRFFRDAATIEPLSRVELGPGAQHIVQSVLQDIRSPVNEGPATVDPALLDVLQLAWESETLAGESYGAAEIARLLEHIDAQSWWVATWCMLALERLDARSAVPALIASEGAGAKFNALAKMATPEAVDFLIECLESPDESLRTSAISGLHDAGRWAAPLLVELLDDPSLASDPPIPPLFNDPLFDISQFDDWPQHHAAQTALFRILHNAGLRGRSINLATGQRPEKLSVEIKGIKTWWAEHGRDFLDGKPVPVAPITDCYSAS